MENGIQFRIESCNGILSHPQLEDVLRNLPLSVKIREGRKLPADEKDKFIQLGDKPIMLVEHGAQLITLRPLNGKRIYDACFYTNTAKAFSPSRVFDENSRYGETNSYSFDTKELGLPFSQGLMLDIHKYGGKR